MLFEMEIIRMINKTNKLFQIFNYTFFILLGVVTLYPFWYTLIGSIISYSEFAQSVVLLFPKKITFSAYVKIFSDNIVPNAYMVTIFTSVIGTFLSLLFTTMAAYVFSRRVFPGRNIIFLLIIFTMLFQGGLIPLFIILSKYGLINSIWVYIFPKLINVFYLIIMKTNFEGIPVSLEEAAKIDGCSDMSILLKIFIPVSLPILATIGLFYMVDKWNDLFTGIFFISDSKKRNLQVLIFDMINSTESADLSVSDGSGGALVAEQLKLASIMVATLPIAMIYPFIQKYFVKGVMIGSVKG